MMFTTSFEQLKCDALSYLPELPSGVHFGVNSLKLHNCHSNLRNPLSMSRASLQCINLIMHTYCALHCAMVDCCFSHSGVLFLKQYSGFLYQASITSYLPIYVFQVFLKSSVLHVIPKYLGSVVECSYTLHNLNILFHST